MELGEGVKQDFVQDLGFKSILAFDLAVGQSKLPHPNCSLVTHLRIQYKMFDIKALDKGQNGNSST